MSHKKTGSAEVKEWWMHGWLLGCGDVVMPLFKRRGDLVGLVLKSGTVKQRVGVSGHQPAYIISPRQGQLAGEGANRRFLNLTSSATSIQSPVKAQTP